MLLLSDWHIGEVIFPNQIGGKNQFNMRIAEERLKTLARNTIDLLKNHTVNPNYPGIMLALGGDIVSGTIHEELQKSTDTPIMKAVNDAKNFIIGFVDTMLEHFPKVYIAGVVGNHGRTTRKPSMKNRVFENYEWLIYQIIADHYAAKSHTERKRVQCYIPDSADALIRIFNLTYNLTHGDQFRGGDAMIGHAGPLIRGDQRKRARQNQIGQDYDIMIGGHWHSTLVTPRLIFNPCLSGYDELAYLHNYPYEDPAQLLWLNHPVRGISKMHRVQLEEPKFQKLTSKWVSYLDHKNDS